MEIITLLILFGVGMCIFGIGYFMKDHLFIIMSATIFILIGLPMFINGLEHKIGFTELETEIGENHTTTQINTYEDNYPIISRGIGLILIWLGIYILLIGWDFWKSERDEGFLN